MSKRATAVSLQPGGVRKPIQTGSIIIGLEGVLESVSKRKINDPKVGQDNHIRNFRVGCSTVRGAAGTRSRQQNSVSQHGSAGSTLNGSQRRECHGAERLDPRKENHGESRACINAIRAATRERDELEVDAN